MSEFYRLEACSVCGVVRLATRTALTDQRERDARSRGDGPEYPDGTTVWRVDFCPPCLRAYEEASSTGESAEEQRSGEVK